MSRVLLASECLSGAPCRYHGRPDARYRRRVERIALELQADEVVWVCPETLGGLATPRPAGRRRRGRIWADGIVGGTDLTPAFERGAAQAVAIARRVKPCAIVLFARSPSCDPEWGLAGRHLRELGVPVIVLGDVRGRPHLVSRAGCRRRGPSDQAWFAGPHALLSCVQSVRTGFMPFPAGATHPAGRLPPLESRHGGG